MNYEQVKKIHATWIQEAGDLRSLAWSDLSAVTGEGSDVVGAVRDCADPGQAAADSIATRLTDMADLLSTFVTNMKDLDLESSWAFTRLTPR